MDYIQPGHLYSRILDNIPWKSGDPNAKGDPRKSVKWIDVSSLMLETLGCERP